MSLLEKLQSRPMPLAVLMGVTFTQAEPDKVVATMLVREDLCTLGHTIHGGAVMAFADSVGAAATVINLPVIDWSSSDARCGALPIAELP